MLVPVLAGDVAGADAAAEAVAAEADAGVLVEAELQERVQFQTRWRLLML